MTYEKIKQHLNDARTALREGRVSAAHELVQACTGQGLTPHDLSTHFTKEELSQLRNYVRSLQP